MKKKKEYPKYEGTYQWTQEEFEKYLSTKDWSEEIKDRHRQEFEGEITFEDGKINY